jgi:two-component system nitrate/nitrite response regulator NarL
MDPVLTAPIRVLVVDDHPVVRDGVAALLEDNRRIRVVGYANNGTETLELMPRAAPDVVLLDLRLPDMLAAELVPQIRRQAPAARIVIFTAFPEHPAVEATLRSGAHGVLVKDAGRTDLVEAILRVCGGGGDREGTGGTAEPQARTAAQKRSSLVTPREYDVLRRVAMGATNRKIADDLDLSPNTVKAYFQSVLEKLGAKNRVQAVSRAREMGLL